MGEARAAGHCARDARAAASARAHRLPRASSSAPLALPLPSAPASTTGSLHEGQGQYGQSGECHCLGSHTQTNRLPFVLLCLPAPQAQGTLQEGEAGGAVGRGRKTKGQAAMIEGCCVGSRPHEHRGGHKGMQGRGASGIGTQRAKANPQAINTTHLMSTANAKSLRRATSLSPSISSMVLGTCNQAAWAHTSSLTVTVSLHLCLPRRCVTVSAPHCVTFVTVTVAPGAGKQPWQWQQPPSPLGSNS